MLPPTLPYKTYLAPIDKESVVFAVKHRSRPWRHCDRSQVVALIDLWRNVSAIFWRNSHSGGWPDDASLNSRAVRNDEVDLVSL
jgi:hypothetical protein